jgi:rubrerythrin
MGGDQMPTKRVDAKTVLSEAVHREQAAHDLYARLAAMIENPAGAKTFAHLAEDEAGHRALLESWWRERYREPFPYDAKKIAIREIKVTDRTGALEALEDALEFEEAAATGYEALAAGAEDAELRKLCEDLARQEWGHFETVRTEISAITGDFYWFDLDFAGHLED